MDNNKKKHERHEQYEQYAQRKRELEPILKVTPRGLRVDSSPADEHVSEDVNRTIDQGVKVLGTVVGCLKLNVRKGPSLNDDVVGVVEKGTTLSLVEEESTKDFYKVDTGELKGFCMKKFIR